MERTSIKQVAINNHCLDDIDIKSESYFPRLRGWRDLFTLFRWAFNRAKGPNAAEDKAKYEQCMRRTALLACEYFDKKAAADDGDTWSWMIGDDNAEIVGTAYRMVGDMYRVGILVEQNGARAISAFKRFAWLQHNFGGYLDIGDMYYYGEGVPQDTAKANEWYLYAVKYREWCVGNYYFYGRRVEQDYAKALEWYKKYEANLPKESGETYYQLLYSKMSHCYSKLKDEENAEKYSELAYKSAPRDSKTFFDSNVWNPNDPDLLNLPPLRVGF